MASVILVRHSRSTANTAGVLAGQAPGISLDETGFTQAQGLTARIGDVLISRVISSPLQRCIETISPWHEKYGKTEIEIDNNFIESDYGSWTGQKLSELAKEPLWKSVQKSPSTVTFPEGESFQAMFKRVSNGLDSIIDKFIDRATVGKAKYGTDLDRNDLSLEDWLEHSIQEKMDDILYMQKTLKVVREAKKS